MPGSHDLGRTTAGLELGPLTCELFVFMIFLDLRFRGQCLGFRVSGLGDRIGSSDLGSK